MRILAVLACFVPAVVHADDIGSPPPVVHEVVHFHDVQFDVVRVDLSRAEVRLFWKDDEGKAIRGLRALEKHVKREGDTLLFATNAGIYSKDFTPAGLHVEHGEEVHGVNLREGGGNFHLMPNGVFYVDERGAHVAESNAYQTAAPTPIVATQSGPLLVSDGTIHPKFREESESVYVRSGVGIRSATEVIFVLSKAAVNFHTFASVFRDALGCDDALYLDGQISRFYMPGTLEEAGPALYVGMLAVLPREAMASR